MPLLSGDDDPLGVDDLTTHRLPLEEAPHACDIFQKKCDIFQKKCGIFQKKEDGCIKVVLKP